MLVFPQGHQNGSSVVVQKLLGDISSKYMEIISSTPKQY